MAIPHDFSFQILVLAAGRGSRMHSNTIKVLHTILGTPLISRVVRSGLDAGAARVVAITGFQGAQVQKQLRRTFGDNVHFAVQSEPQGTGHAVWSARNFLSATAPQYTVVVSGDVPNLSAETLRSFVTAYVESKDLFGIITANLTDGGPYGRVIRRPDLAVDRVVEFKDATPEEKAVTEVSTGTYIGPTDFFLRELDDYLSAPPDNAQGEWYLPELIERAAKEGSVFGWPIPDLEQIQGVNTRYELSTAYEYARRVVNRRWMLAGVTMLDPASTHIDEQVTLERDVILGPNVQLIGETKVAEGALIDAGCILTNAIIASHVHLKPYSVVTSSSIGSNSEIGPFAHIRPQSNIREYCKVGNFVEVKKTTLEPGAKASHLTYLGDATVGADANIGAGTITCNYDGHRKHETIIGPGAFIGSNSSLIAPVEVGAGAIIGAGSAISADVPPHALGIERSKQQIREEWAAKRRIMNKNED